ncbi:putative lipase atg15 [Zalaria obscura]|uniref:Lipase atg15 n=1 Tax=Zalaria obscura TaxID=2024903 RepID=A0ACC3S390_9PEZI
MRSVGSLLSTYLALSAGLLDRAFAARRDRYDQHVLLPPGPVVEAPDAAAAPILPREHEFTLRHIYHHGSHDYPGLHRKIDIHPHSTIFELTEDGTIPAQTSFKARSRSMTIQRMADRRRETVDKLLEAGRLRGEAASLPPSAWSMDEIPGPNISDKETVITFARMAANAYILTPGDGEWEDVEGGFNYTEDFGWEADGLRGHIFADTENSTVVIGLKGTSLPVYPGADTTGNDKMNDNLFGSCCCAQGGQYLWRQVCDCMTSTYTCNSSCLVKSLREKSHYYHAVQDLYHNVTARYPKSDVWLSGHSLGGVVSGLLGLTFGLPALTYETFPDALAASRLGLPTPPGYHIGSHQARLHTGTYHFGHTADPIFMGTCNAASSFCTIAGYAFQGQCHTGSTCVYDTVGDLGWRVGIGTHKIHNVINDVLIKYDSVANCTQDIDCVDCYNWKFYESNGTESTSTSSSTSTSTRTRTATCQTPGWWGCLDESTTTGASTTTTTVTTTTCKTPGWFGCNDPTTTTETSTSTISTPAAAPAPTITTPSTSTHPSSSRSSSSTSCKTPGVIYGCKDKTTTTHTAGVTAEPSSRPKPSSLSPTTSTTCTEKEWFGLVCVDPSPDGKGKKEKEASRTVL